VGAAGALMPSVELDDQEWQHVMSLLSEAPWRVANPLLMKIGAQLQRANKQTTNSQETPAAQGDPSRAN
jgi:hypothetical protein